MRPRLHLILLLIAGLLGVSACSPPCRDSRCSHFPSEGTRRRAATADGPTTGSAAEPATTTTAAPGTAAPAAAAPAGAGCPDDDVNRNLMAMVSHGEALPDHVGPDAARAIFADLDRQPAAYLDRFECRYVTPSPTPGYDSLLLAVPLWRLHKHDAARVAQLASRVNFRYEELSRTPPDPAVDPHFAQRIRERTATMSFLRDGLDVPPGPRWRTVTGFASCLTASPDGHTTAIRVTRECSCGETLSCTATVGARGNVELAVKYDPDSPAMCTDCYPTSTSCTVPATAAKASLPARCSP